MRWFRIDVAEAITGLNAAGAAAVVGNLGRIIHKSGGVVESVLMYGDGSDVIAFATGQHSDKRGKHYKSEKRCSFHWNKIWLQMYKIFLYGNYAIVFSPEMKEVKQIL